MLGRKLAPIATSEDRPLTPLKSTSRQICDAGTDCLANFLELYSMTVSLTTSAREWKLDAPTVPWWRYHEEH